MAIGGTKVYCPGCKSFQICVAISPTRLGEPKAQRWHHIDHTDIAWFRRGRRCQHCSHTFLSAEVDEAFIDELVELRRRVAERQKVAVNAIFKRSPWLKREETIPLEVAREFIRASAWWLTHSSGSPVRAPRHAERIYKSHHGWAINFGGNTFLVGKAIERCRNKINDYLDNAIKGQLPLKSEVIASLKRQISGAVANADGYEYSGYYPIEGGDLRFGAQAIDVTDGASYMIQKSGLEDLLLSA